MVERVTVTVADHVADVRLNRPEKLNALDAPMFEALVATGRALRDRGDVRCVVLSGEGRAFSAGLDFASFMAMGAAGERPGAELLGRDDGPANRAQQTAHVWTSLPVPVVVALHGVAFGGGLQIALGGDIRLVAPDARLSVKEIQWGLVPDMTGTQTLRHLMRLDVAKELTFTGREVLGEEAVAIGLATRVARDPHGEALALARTIAGQSPDAIRAGKKLLNEAAYLDEAEGLLREERAQVALMGTPNQLEAVAANLQKRLPEFR